MPGSDAAIEELRVMALINAVYAIDGFEMNTREALEVLSKVDAVTVPHPRED